jgi:Na+-translocating ferredoxin:NAD+ oxidoreductase subunit C
MALRQTFRGGVHPEEHKQLTCNEPIRPLSPPSKVIVPLQQHLGAPAVATVKVGERVAEGQPLAEPQGFVSVPVHAPIAGEVTAIGPHPHPGGFEAESITIEKKDGDESPPWRLPGFRPDYASASAEELKNLIRDAGLVGMGGAAFPTHVKLSPPASKPIDTLIINGAECEPYLTCDHRVMVEDTEQVAHGIRILKQIMGVRRVLVGIEANKPDAVEVLTKALAGDREIQVVSCHVKYPQGAEKQLIKVLTGREVPPPPGLPMDVGAVVQNVGTAAAVARAVMEGIPLIERVVTISGSVVRKPSNLRVRLGTPVTELVEACGGLTEPPAKVVMGGPMMGVAQADLTVPVVKSTSGFIFFSRREVPNIVPYPCLHCGRCVDACPLGLEPSELALRVEVGELDAAEALHLRECMECGSCSYTCPSSRWLVQAMRLGKARLNERKQ